MERTKENVCGAERAATGWLVGRIRGESWDVSGVSEGSGWYCVGGDGADVFIIWDQRIACVF